MGKGIFSNTNSMGKDIFFLIQILSGSLNFEHSKRKTIDNRAWTVSLQH